MTRRNPFPSDLQKPARQAASHPWMDKLARLGYAAKGIVYFVVGLLAAQAAFTTGGRTTDTSGALATIVNQPFGRFLLVLITIGLIGYVLWRTVQALFDPAHSSDETNIKRIAQRMGYAFSAIAYTGLAWTAMKLIIGTKSSNSNATQDWTARFMAQPFGRWAVGLAGLVVIGVGISYLYEAYKAKFQRHFKHYQMSETERHWTKWVGQIGITARGVVFGIIGLFLVLAALHSNASEAVGLGGALAALARQPFGPWLLGIVALGLIAYSIYSLTEARYRRITQPQQQPKH
ncbi:DUF1206 domain-containing protein [Oculatella sp. LEGE 06141]|uniref:DUF1206 domain-containing protein n=1 Tax=Oculatella sp. LEGE 06141 TaxID=1828648 RepID=UPI00188017FC|nr:DUF1206 domain-containing protein [Oculatella sp. LEGE 06141]MBE9182475.1 DUF1206 domain-containing protein [Oculatella sp. LEGE 06141]